MGCALAILAVALCAQEPSEVGRLFEELQVPATSDQATEQLLKVGRTNPSARAFLAKRLPFLIEKGPYTPPWTNAVRLAGELKIAEASPALANWIGLNAGMATTITQHLRLEDNPSGKALVQIGDPSVPALQGVLEHRDLEERTNAVYALRLIGSTLAKRTLRAHEKRESDPSLRAFIQKTLAKWSLQRQTGEHQNIASPAT